LSVEDSFIALTVRYQLIGDYLPKSKVVMTLKAKALNQNMTGVVH
jgi:hypothetical protein